MKKEMVILEKEPPPGISCWQVDDKINQLQATILGNEDSPYKGGLFKLDISLPDRYPFEPPKVRFTTPIYHPNIDNGGRICLDILKPPPKGAWKPALNISTMLTSIQLLMNNPNPDDPLMTDIAYEYRNDKPSFLKKAQESTKTHAMSDMVGKPPDSLHGKRKSDAEVTLKEAKILKESN